MLKFDANLYRIATACQSSEETRYYLKGVFVSPHPVTGVLLVATDGHKLICLHDETGAADESAIIALSPEALKACKLGKGEDRRTVVIDGASATVTAFTGRGENETSEPVAISAKCRIDGTFPDWRRVVPTPELPAKSVASFNGLYIGLFGKIAADLEKHYQTGSNASLRIVGSDQGSPHLVLFGSTASAFGVLMPVRNDTAPVVPEWLNAKA